MEELYLRTSMLLGDKIDKLRSAKILICGLGGVGGYALEALARAGGGELHLLDSDCFAPSNLNRQILATIDAIGRKKTDVAKERVLRINPNCKVQVFDFFYLPETADRIDLSAYDYIVDAIDTVTAKLELITRAKACGTEIISCMGTGNKLGTSFEVADIYKTSVCPLAKVMRKELKAKGIDHLKVVYSKEEQIIPVNTPTEGGRHIPGSISYSPAIAGLVLAATVIQDLTK